MSSSIEHTRGPRSAAASMHLLLAVPVPAFLGDPAGAGPLPPMLSPSPALYLPRSRLSLRFLLDATSRMPSSWLLPPGCG